MPIKCASKAAWWIFDDRLRAKNLKFWVARKAKRIQAPRLTKCYNQNGRASDDDLRYARVSTDGQTLDAQHAKLTEAGAEKIFSEKERRSQDGSEGAG
jgi:hypothetical protein